MKYASPASRRVRRLVSSLRMTAAPVRCSVNEVAVDSGAPVALSPTSRTRHTRGPSTPIKPWAMVLMWGAPAVNSAGAAAVWAAGVGSTAAWVGCSAAGDGGCAGRSCAAARSIVGNSVATLRPSVTTARQKCLMGMSGMSASSARRGLFVLLGLAGIPSPHLAAGTPGHLHALLRSLTSVLGSLPEPVPGRHPVRAAIALLQTLPSGKTRGIERISAQIHLVAVVVAIAVTIRVGRVRADGHLIRIREAVGVA